MTLSEQVNIQLHQQIFGKIFLPYLIPRDVIDEMNMKGYLLEKKKLPTVSLKTRKQSTLSRNAKETII